MFENIGSFFKKIMKNDTKELVSDTTATNTSKEAAKERLQLVLMQDRANVSADFLELMKQEIVDVIKKYIVVEEETIDVRIINQENEDGTQGAPSLCANIPILNIRNDNKGEKFRREQSLNITKDISIQKVENSSNNDSNDNVEIEDVDEVVEENIVQDNDEIALMNNDLEEEKVNINEENIVQIENNDKIDEYQENVAEDTDDNDINLEFENKVEDFDEEEENIEEEIIEKQDEDLEDIDELEKRANEAMMNSSIDYDEEDDDDDDVTFDDLLKAAEEEEKMQKEVKDYVEEKKVSPKPKSAARAARASKSTKGKSTTKTSKRKKTTKK